MQNTTKYSKENEDCVRSVFVVSACLQYNIQVHEIGCAWGFFK